MLNNTHLDFAIEMGLKKITWAGHNNTLKIVLTKEKIIITTITHNSHQLEGEGVTTSRLSAGFCVCLSKKPTRHKNNPSARPAEIHLRNEDLSLLISPLICRIQFDIVHNEW